MRFRALALVPIVIAAALVLAALLSHDAATQRRVLLAGSEIAKAMALVGCAWAALAFERGDYLRRAWALNGLCLALLLLRDTTLTPLFGLTALLGRRLVLTQGLVVLLANALGVAGTWILARVWQIAGLALPGTQRNHRFVLVSAALLAVAITGVPFVLDLRVLLHGDPVAVVAIASDLGDAVSLALIAPVLLTALAMRGGLLAWPWGFFTAGLLCWLFYDALAPLGHVVHISPRTLQLVREVLRSLACTCTFAAGVAQRSIVRRDVA